MGILNVTPDSFSDGGRYTTVESAVERAKEMVDEGASIIDVGGESTRPGARPVSASEELRRVLPVIERLAELRFDDPASRDARERGRHVPVSIDTRHVSVARAAFAAGASIVNCVAPLGESMVRAANDAHAAIIARCRSRGDWERAIRLAGDASRVVFDPMIGFGTTRREDLALLAQVPDFARFAPVAIGVSRKRIVRCLASCVGPDRREPDDDPLRFLGGSIGAALWCAAHGVAIVRVHDVRETAQALALTRVMDDVSGHGKGAVPA